MPSHKPSETENYEKNNTIPLMLLVAAMPSIISCIYETHSKTPAHKTEKPTDTIIVKHKQLLDKAYEIGFLSKSYSYYWLSGKDTLDFIVNATEYEKDSSVHLSVFHKNPVSFKSVLNKLKECFTLITEDFYLSKIKSFFFQAPIFYLDIAKELTNEYEKQFGRKLMGHEKLDQFLLKSNLNHQIESFVTEINKKAAHYSIEKFHLTDKIQFTSYLPSADISDFPEFLLDGMGIQVQLENTRR